MASMRIRGAFVLLSCCCIILSMGKANAADDTDIAAKFDIDDIQKIIGQISQVVKDIAKFIAELIPKLGKVISEIGEDTEKGNELLQQMRGAPLMRSNAPCDGITPPELTEVKDCINCEDGNWIVIDDAKYESCVLHRNAASHSQWSFLMAVSTFALSVLLFLV